MTAAAAELNRPGGGLRALVLALLCLAMFLPGLGRLPPTDRDESRFAQASRQMVESGNYIDIRFQDEPRYKKPVGIYWLQSAAVALVGEGAASPIWVYRLPSLLGALCAVLLLYGVGRRFAGDDTAFAAAALLGAALTLNIEARLAKTDASLLMATTGTLAIFGLVYVRTLAGQAVGRLLPLAGWALMGAGVLIKGPITPMVAGLTLVSLAIADRGRGRTLPFLKALRPVSGLLLVALVALPWLIAITLISNGQFLANSVGGDLAGKLTGGAESHGAPPGYYLVTMAAMLWPGALLVGLGLPWAFARCEAPFVRFCLAWAVPSFIAFELFPTKLPHYTLPCYPALLLLGVAAARDGFRPATRLGRIWRGLVLGAFGVVGVTLGLGLAGIGWHFEGTPGLAGIGAVVVAVVTTAAVLVLERRRQIGRAVMIMVVGAAAVYATAFMAILPGIDALWPSRALAQRLNDLGLMQAPALVATGYSEPSLVFLTRTDIDFAAPAEAALALRDRPGAVVLVDGRVRAAFDAALGDVAVEDLGHVGGLNVSRGRLVDIAILRRAP